MKNKIPLCVISSDWHLKKENVSQILDLIGQKIELCEELNVKDAFCLGDALDNRISQRLEVLKGFESILKKFDNPLLG